MLNISWWVQFREAALPVVSMARLSIYRHQSRTCLHWRTLARIRSTRVQWTPASASGTSFRVPPGPGIGSGSIQKMASASSIRNPRNRNRMKGLTVPTADPSEATEPVLWTFHAPSRRQRTCKRVTFFIIFIKNGPIPAFFVYFRPFLVTKSIKQIEKV